MNSAREGRSRRRDAERPCDVAERDSDWRGAGFGSSGSAVCVSRVGGRSGRGVGGSLGMGGGGWGLSRVAQSTRGEGAVKKGYMLQPVKEEELKTETVAWGIKKNRVKF